MTLEDKIGTFLQLEWEAGNETKKQSVDVATGYLENIWQTISENPDEELTVEGMIKSGLVSHVDGYANDQDLTDALKKIIEAEKGAA